MTKRLSAGDIHVRPPGDDFFFMHDLNTELLLDGKAELESGSAIACCVR